jgi:hypothetical protein
VDATYLHPEDDRFLEDLQLVDEDTIIFEAKNDKYTGWLFTHKETKLEDTCPYCRKDKLLSVSCKCKNVNSFIYLFIYLYSRYKLSNI